MRDAFRKFNFDKYIYTSGDETVEILTDANSSALRHEKAKINNETTVA